MTWPPKPRALKPPRKPRRRNASPEADFQKTVTAYLERALPPEAGVFWSATMNGVRVSLGVRATLRAQGLRPGVFDFVFIPLVGPMAGQTFWLELKAPKGRLTDEQAVLMDVLYPAGRGAQARTLEQVCAALVAWSFPIRAYV